jgi:hypothetical protein
MIVGSECLSEGGGEHPCNENMLLNGHLLAEWRFDAI